MSYLSRRQFLYYASAVPSTVWLEQQSQAQTPQIRPDATTPQGQQMLRIYADAVRMMKQLPEGDPTAWVFQWYTHAVRSDKGKAQEILRIYPTASPSKSLAQDMWETCQAHHPGANEDYFLPWHRMYIYFFERIVRKVTGRPEFLLPYWNYDAAGAGRALPPEFRMNNDATYGSLFVENRNTFGGGHANVNAGEPIDKNSPGALTLQSLSQCVYSPVPPAIQGFCLALDRNPHGGVHVLVGNALNMGDVPWAARDPIFWLHHCNIDRLWASWNRGGRKNPDSAAYLRHEFIFADENGIRVAAKVQDFLATEPLGYTYDRFEAVPACPPSAPHDLLLHAVPPRRHAEVRQRSVHLGAEAVRVTLEPLANQVNAAHLPESVKAVQGSRRLFLVIRGLQAQSQPGVTFRLFLNLPPNLSPRAAAAYQVGTIHFFDAVGHGDHNGGAANAQKFDSFDVTDLVKKLQARGQLGAKPTLTIVPDGRPAANAKPVLGEIALIEQ